MKIIDKRAASFVELVLDEIITLADRHDFLFIKTVDVQCYLTHIGRFCIARTLLKRYSPEGVSMFGLYKALGNITI